MKKHRDFNDYVWLLQKLLRIMRLTCILILVFVLGTKAACFSQAGKLNLNLKNGTLVEALEQIEDQSEYYFYYNNDEVRNVTNISIKADNGKIEDVLKELLSGTGLTYKVVDRFIVVKKGEDPVNGQGQQQKNVTGKVTDPSGFPLPGVTMVVKGTTQGAITNADGNYSLSNVPGDAILVFSFVGMKTQEIPVGEKSMINVTMVEETIGIKEVVAIGYGVRKKENVIGSVVAVSGEDIESASVPFVTNAIAGRLPGATVMQSSGEPGKDIGSILIRGQNTLGETSPLIVIDGVAGRSLLSVNNNDIESITILKDASASIYGTRAANGVILVTTKRGQQGLPKFSYNGYQGLTTPTMLMEMANAPTYAKMIRESQSYSGISESGMSYSIEDIEKFESGEYPWTHPNTDWYKETLKKFTKTGQHNLSVNGGTEIANYYVGVGYRYDDAIYKNSSTNYDRYNLTSNLNFDINKYLSLGIHLNNILEKREYPGARSSYDIFKMIGRMPPTFHAYYPNGLPGIDLERGDNPVVTCTDATGFYHEDTYWCNNKLTANFKVPGVKGLSVKGTYAFDVKFSEAKRLEKPWTLYSLDEEAYYAAGNTGKEDGSEFLIGSERAPSGLSEPRVTNNFSKYKTKVTNLIVNYERTFKKVHNVSGFIGYESYEYNANGIEAFRRYFVSDQLPYLFAGGDEEKDNDEWVELDAVQSYLGRLSYSYKETYLVDFTFRRDGSIRFSKESGRWGNFPSLLLGWRISNENFWKNNLNFIDYFKLKASWGVMGNDAVPAFQYLNSYEFSEGLVTGSSKNYYSGLAQAGAPNPEITWETANIYNLGFESRFLDSKMTFNTDLFFQRRTDILVTRNASVPNFTGIQLPDENYGIVESKGIELELGYEEREGAVTYGISANLAFNNNKIVEFDEPERTVPWQVLTGHPRGSFLIYKSLGIFKDEADINSYPHVAGARPGDVIIEDYDGDGEITADDRVIFEKTSVPKITYGIPFWINYKNWRLSGLVQGAGNSAMRIYYEIQGTGGNYFKFDTEDRWTPENTDATNPRAFERENEYWRSSYVTDRQYHNTDFIRLKNLTLTYELPENFIAPVKLSKAELYVSGQNLFLLYNATKVMDPENAVNIYPLMKVYSLGARISF